MWGPYCGLRQGIVCFPCLYLTLAVSCIGESFGVDPDSSSDKSQYSLAPANLISLLDVYNKIKAKSGPSASAPAPAAPTAAAPSSSEPSSADKAKAESLKTTGNSQMSQKLYDSAIASYTSAIALSPNPVYYSNRAAAWGALGEHGKAADDAQRAIDLDPKFVKGYSRLGHARFSMGDYSAAVKAYEEGLTVEPGNANMRTSLQTARQKMEGEDDDEEEGAGAGDVRAREAGAGGAGGAGGMPDLSALAGLMGGMGGGGRGGGGGMPDLASLMNNPQMMQMYVTFPVYPPLLLSDLFPPHLTPVWTFTAPSTVRALVFALLLSSTGRSR